MNTTRNHLRLDRLATEIDSLRTQVIETERAAFEMFDSDLQSAVASAAVIEVKAKLQDACLAYVLENEVVRHAEQTARKAAA